ncbi:MAG: hypothetical protein ACREV6_13780 [Clostridium sp.]|uniref:hypothetical protein n=1 Tax=Clostridium sp. TaxID=1506 RepID=UPI003D6C9806
MNKGEIINNKLILTVFKITLILLVVFIILFQLKEKLNTSSQPPSPEWAKEVKVSSGNVTTGVKLIKFQGNYVLAHNDGKNIEILRIDALGNVLKKERIPVDFTELYNIALIEDGNYLYLFVASLNLTTDLTSFKLDKDFHVLETKPYLGQNEVSQVDDNSCIVSSWGKAEFINYKENISKIVEGDLYRETCGVKTKKGYLFVCSNKLSGIECLIINNGKIIKKNNFSDIIPPSLIFHVNSVTISADNEYAYLLLSIGIRGGKIQQQTCIQFGLDNNVVKQYYFKDSPLTGFVALKSNSGGRFLAKSFMSGQITEVVMKNGKINYESDVSRLNKLNTFQSGNEDYVAFCNYEKFNTYGIYVTSKSEDFKVKHSGKTLIEKKRALSSEMAGIASIGFQIFTLAFNWLIPILLVVSIYSIACFKYKYEIQKIFFIIFSVAAGILKSCVLYTIVFAKYSTMLPEIMNSPVMITGICILISVISYGYSYTRYCTEEGGLFVVRFLPGLILDTLITLLIFVPFITNLN